jgi:hypothetical protein
MTRATRRPVAKERRREFDARGWPASFCSFSLDISTPTPSASHRAQSRSLRPLSKMHWQLPTRHVFMHETRRGITSCEEPLLGPNVIIGHLRACKLTVSTSISPYTCMFRIVFPEDACLPPRCRLSPLMHSHRTYQGFLLWSLRLNRPQAVIRCSYSGSCLARAART